MKKGCLWFVIVCCLLLWWCSDDKEQSNSESSSSMASSSDQLKDRGLSYTCNMLKAPSTATLLQYANAEQTKQILADAGVHLQPGYSMTMYRIESTNGFGGRIASWYFCLFKNSEPIFVAEEEDKPIKEFFRTYFICVAINHNCKETDIGKIDY